MPTPEKPVVVTVRLKPAFSEKLKATFWRTAPKHRQSYNAWLCAVLAAGLEKKS